MTLDEELEGIEEPGETEAELIDQQTELEDFEGDEDEILGEEAEEADLEHAYDSFSTANEADYDGFDEGYAEEEADLDESAAMLRSRPDAFHLEDSHDLEEQVVEMEIEEGDIYALIVDEDDNEIGFILLDEDGNEQEYYYVDAGDGESIDAEGDAPAHAVRASDGEAFDLGVTKEEVAEGMPDLKEVYRESVEVVGELRDTLSDLSETLSFLKRKK